MPIMNDAVDLDVRLRAVFSSVFGVDSARLDDRDSPATIAEWDSLNHLNLVLSLEGEFGVAFAVDEIMDLNSVGAIRRRLAAELHGDRV